MKFPLLQLRGKDVFVLEDIIRLRSAFSHIQRKKQNGFFFYYEKKIRMSQTTDQSEIG